jgi:hypothetical protein
MLTGTELLARIQASGDGITSELIRDCGYAVTRDDGRELLDVTEFYSALIRALSC